MSRNTILGKALPPVIGVVALVFAVAMTLQWRQMNGQRDRRLKDNGIAMANVMNAALHNAMLKGDNEGAQVMTAEVGNAPDVRRAFILRTDAKVFLGSDRAMIGKPYAAEDVQRLKAGGTASFGTGQDGDRHFSRILVPVLMEQACADCHPGVKPGEALGYLGVEPWIDKDVHEAEAARRQLLGFNLAVVLIVGISIFLLLRWITRPLGQITAAAARIAKGEVDQSLEHHSRDELGVLADSFRSLIAYIKGIATAAGALSEGNLKVAITPQGDKDLLSRNMIQVTEVLAGMAEETSRLSLAAREGRLEVRGNAGKFNGAYGRIVVGMNDTLDAVVAPVNDVMRVMGDIEQGNLAARITTAYRGDFQKLAEAINGSAAGLGRTLGEISGAANTLASRADGMAATSKTMAGNAEQMTMQARTAAAGTEQASASVQHMAAGVERISSNSNSMATASVEVSANLNSVGAAVEQMSANLRTIAASSEQMQGSVTSVAAAIEEMSVSLGEVSRNSGQAAMVANKAADSATRSAGIVEQLGRSAKEIGKVVELIKTIAAQTNLLALNATIEAASAGDAGKGFAVVANEVKELAKQTGSATEEIRAQVEAMQGDTRQAVQAIDEIVRIIADINAISTSIAASVREQTTTTNEISRSVGSAALGASEVSRNVAQAATGANEVSRTVQEAVRGVTDISRSINLLATGATDVARNAVEAAAGVNDVARNVLAVSGAAEGTTRDALDTKAASGELARLAELLKASVARFRL